MSPRQQVQRQRSNLHLLQVPRRARLPNQIGKSTHVKEQGVPSENPHRASLSRSSDIRAFLDAEALPLRDVRGTFFMVVSGNATWIFVAFRRCFPYGVFVANLDSMDATVWKCCACGLLRACDHRDVAGLLQRRGRWRDPAL